MLNKMSNSSEEKEINEGDCKKDKYEGKGIYYYENGNKQYEGDWKNGNYEGKGIFYDENGNKQYEGDFKNGNYEGKGIKYKKQTEILNNLKKNIQ